MAEPIVIAQHRQRAFDGGRALLVEGLRVDMDNCASVVAANTNRTKKQVLRAMLTRTTLHPEAALEWGLAHEIRQQLFEDGAEVISIQARG